MPIRVTCPNCAKTFNTPDANAGRKARCGGCGTIVTIPDAATDLYDLEPPATSPAPRVAPELDDFPESVATPIQAATADAGKSPPLPAARGETLAMIPDEPWYYRYLVIYGWFLGGCAIFQFAVTCLFLMYLISSATGRWP